VFFNGCHRQKAESPSRNSNVSRLDLGQRPGERVLRVVDNFDFEVLNLYRNYPSPSSYFVDFPCSSFPHYWHAEHFIFILNNKSQNPATSGLCLAYNVETDDNDNHDKTANDSGDNLFILLLRSSLNESPLPCDHIGEGELPTRIIALFAPMKLFLFL